MRVVDAPAMRRAERNLLWFFYCSLYTVQSTGTLKLWLLVHFTTKYRVPSVWLKAYLHS